MSQLVLKRILLLLIMVSSLHVWAEQKHFVDFEESFYKKTPFSRWMRDPFRNPPGFAKVGEDKPSWPKLTTVSVKEGKIPFAILNGKKYKEGQFVDENRYVSAIGQNYVILTEGNFDYELVVPDPKRAPASGEGKK